MAEKAKISGGQLTFLTYGAAAGNLIYTFTFVTYLTGRPFWIACGLGVALNIPFAIWILLLGRHKEGFTLFEILESGMGKIVSKILIIIYLFINVLSAACMLNMFTGTIKVFFLQRTPPFVIMLFLVVMCTMFVGSGLNTFGRLLEILVASYMANYFLGFSLSFTNKFNIEYVVPVFDTCPTAFFNGVLVSMAASAECLLLLMVLVGSVPKPHKQLSQVVKGLLVWSVLLAVAIFIMEGMIGSDLMSRVAQAGITVSRTIQIGDFVRGLEILLLITYQYFAITKITIFLYSCSVSSEILFHVRKSKILLFLSAVAIFAVSIWMNSFNSGYFFSIFLSVYGILPFSLLVLLLSTISVKIIKKGNINSK